MQAPAGANVTTAACGSRTSKRNGIATMPMPNPKELRTIDPTNTDEIRTEISRAPRLSIIFNTFYVQVAWVYHKGNS